MTPVERFLKAYDITEWPARATEAKAIRIRRHYANQILTRRMTHDTALTRAIRDLHGDNYHPNRPQRYTPETPAND